MPYVELKHFKGIDCLKLTFLNLSVNQPEIKCILEKTSSQTKFYVKYWLKKSILLTPLYECNPALQLCFILPVADLHSKILDAPPV